MCNDQVRSPSHHRGSSHPSASAFTLLEIMLAVTILGLVMTAVFGIWNASLTAWKRGLAVTEDLQRGRIVLEVLDDLAKSAVFFPQNGALYEVVGDFDPQLGSTISFVTVSDCLLPPSETAVAGLRRVIVELDRDAQGRPYLSLASLPALEEPSAAGEPVRRVLSTEVIYFRVRYRDPRDGTWADFWRQPNLLPAALEFTLAFSSGERGVAPVVTTRAVELPGAAYTLAAAGISVTAQSTTNEVLLQDINLSELTEPAEADTE